MDKNLEAWLYLMTRPDLETVRVTKELVANDDAIAQGFYRVSHLEHHEAQSLQDERIAFDSQSLLQNEVYNEGFAGGEKKGLIEGEKKGLIEGEKKTSIAIAKKLQLMGLSPEQISDATGCSSHDIKKSDQN
jgi:predicted transposase/invertase (TIGR01784 family)